MMRNAVASALACFCSLLWTGAFAGKIHGFLRHATWLKAYTATARFLDANLASGPSPSRNGIDR